MSRKETPLQAAQAAIKGLQLTLEATRRARDVAVAKNKTLSDAVWALVEDRVSEVAAEAADEAVSNLEIR